MNEETAQTVGEKIEETVEKAEEVVRKPWVKRLARLGFYTKGFLFIVIGVLALMVVFGHRGGALADATGALARIARLDFGIVLLIIFIVGAVGHGAWNVLRGVADVDDAGKKWQGIIIRISAVGIGIFYFWLAYSAWRIIVFARSADETVALQKTLAAILLALPLGWLLTFLIGLITVGVAFHQCYVGIAGKYQENFRLFTLSVKQKRLVTALGVLSFTARSVLLALVGYFFISAAINYNPDEAVGLDGALATLAESNYGKTLLFITAVGLFAHGILSLYEARFRRIC